MTSCDLAKESLLSVQWLVDKPRIPKGNRAYYNLIYSKNRTQFSESYGDRIPDDGWNVCLPKNECMQLSVKNLDDTEYSIAIDGVNLPVGEKFPYFPSLEQFQTITEIGGSACLPTCAPGESLFELDMFTGEYGGLDWLLWNQESSSIVFVPEDFRLFSNYKFHVYRTCIDATICHRFEIATRYRDLYDPAHNPYFNITVDGELVESVEHFRFEEIKIGSCPSSPCTESEELIEIAVNRWNQPFQPMHWKLTDMNNQESVVFEGEQVFEKSQNNSSKYPNRTTQDHIFTVRECVPRNGCYSLELSKPEVTDEEYAAFWGGDFKQRFYENDDILLTLGGVVYYADDIRFATKRENSSEPAVWSHNFTLGDECAVGVLCDPETELLFQLQLHTEVTGEPIRTGAYQDLSFSMDYHSEESRKGYKKLFYAWHFFNHDFESNTTYGLIQCVPDDECLVFSVKTDSLIESYNISRNGNKIDTEPIVHTDGYWSGSTTTYYGVGCPTTGLSTGAIAGIAVAAAVVLLGLIFVAYKIVTKRQKFAPPESTANGVTDTTVDAEKANIGSSPYDA